MNNKPNLKDPDLFTICGNIFALVGVNEKISRIIPYKRIKISSKHKQIHKLITQFQNTQDKARAQLRIINSTISEDPEIPHDAIALMISNSEHRIHRTAINELFESVKKLNELSYDLEAETEEYSDEKERFCKISQLAIPLVENMNEYLGGIIPAKIEDNAYDLDEDDICGAKINTLPSYHPIKDILANVDNFLERCSNTIEERKNWLEGNQKG